MIRLMSGSKRPSPIMAVEQRLDPVIIATQGPVPGTRPRGNLGAVSHVAEFIQRHGFFFEQGQSARRVFPLNETRASVRCRACRIEVPKDKQVRTRIVDLLAPKSSAKFSLTRVVTVKIWRIDHPGRSRKKSCTGRQSCSMASGMREIGKLCAWAFSTLKNQSNIPTSGGNRRLGNRRAILIGSPAQLSIPPILR